LTLSRSRLYVKVIGESSSRSREETTTLDNAFTLVAASDECKLNYDETTAWQAHGCPRVGGADQASYISRES